MRKALALNVAGTIRRVKELEDAGDYCAASSLLGEVWPSRDELGGLERAELLLRAGLLAGRTGQSPLPGNPHETAKDMLTESMRIFESAGSRRNAAEAAFGIAICCKQDGTFDEARIWLRRTEELTPTADSAFRCKTRLMLAIVEEDDGRLRDALRIHEEIARAFLPDLKEDGLMGRCHNERAIVLKRLWQSEGVTDYADAALVEYAAAGWHHERAGDTRSWAIVENNTANLKLVIGRPLEALEHVESALRLMERIKDRIQIAIFEETRAQTLLRLSRMEAATAAARRSVRLLQIGGERPLLAESLTTLGRCYARGGDQAAALEAFVGAVEVAEFIDFGDGVAAATVALLEESLGLSGAERWEYHRRCLDYVSRTQDQSLFKRHAACLARTCEMLADPARGCGSFSWEGFSLDKAVDEFERFCITLAIRDAGGCQTRAAKLLDVSDSNLYFKLRTKYADLKRLLTKGHKGRKGGKPSKRRTPFLVIDDESLSDFGIGADDILFYRPFSGGWEGRLLVVASKGVKYVGVAGFDADRLVLEPACDEEDFVDWQFDEGTYTVEGEVFAVVKPGTEDAAPLKPTDR